MKATLPASILFVLCACTGLALLLVLAPVAGVAQANQDYASDKTAEDLEEAKEEKQTHKADLKAKEAEQDRLEKQGASHREKQKVAAEANALRDKVAAADERILELTKTLRIEAYADIEKAIAAAERGNPATHLKKAATLGTRWQSGVASFALPTHTAWKQPAGPPTPENVKEAETAKASLESMRAELETEQSLLATELEGLDTWLAKNFPAAANEWAKLKGTLTGIQSTLNARSTAIEALLDDIDVDLRKIDEYIS